MRKNSPGKRKEKKDRKWLWIIPAVIVLMAITVLTLFLIFKWPVREARRLARVQSGEEKLNVLLISVDTLRADYCSCYGSKEVETSNIDRVAAGGTMFTGCNSQVPLTLPSHTAIMTGTYPLYNGVTYNSAEVPEGITTMAEALSEAGYITGAFIGGFPLSEFSGLDQGFTIYDDAFTKGSEYLGTVYETPADKVWLRASEWLDGIGDRNFFLFLHLYDPHAPYEPPYPYSEDYADNLYAGEVKFVDDVIGVVLDKLETSGLRDDTLIIFLSDHGEALGEHGESEHGYFIYDECIHVPLIFDCPGLVPAGKTVNGSVRLVDVYPTVMEILGLDASPEVQGESLVPYIYGGRKPDLETYMESRYATFMYGWSSLFGLEKWPWKYIDAPKPELYDMEKDPDEGHNLVNAEPDIAADMAEELSGLMERLKKAGFKESGTGSLTKSDIDNLAALGYISFTGGEKPPIQPDVDPKDKVEYNELMTDFMRLKTTGRFADAEEVLTKITEIEPDLASTNSQRGFFLRAEGKLEEAEECFERTLEANPGDKVAIIGLASIYLRTGRNEKGESLLVKEIIEDPTAANGDRIDTYLLLALNAREYHKDPDRAITYYEKIIEIDDDYRVAYYALVLLYADKPGHKDEVTKYGEKFLSLVSEGSYADNVRSILAATRNQ
jgi:arylsulfatase A-like enzyme